jgi:hypothetical protein
MPGPTTLPVMGANGEVLLEIPFRQFILNDRQQFACLGCEAGIMKDISLGDGIEHVDYMAIGKLSEQGAVFSLQIVNSLRNENWDFDQYGDPEIVMMTVKEGYGADGRKL